MPLNAAMISTLIRLARADLVRRATLERHRAVPEKLHRVDREVARVKGEIERLDHGLNEARKDRRAREQEALALETRIGQDAGKLNAIRSNVDYQAMLKQIAETKTRKTALENEALELMEREEEITRRLQGEKGRVDIELTALAGERAALLAEEKELESALKALDGERNELLQDLDPELRGRYERIGRSKHGLAVVTVVKGACGGCFAALPPQRVNEVRQQARLVLCDACSRILVWDEENAGQ
jgi:uncharacterized protein